MHELEEELIAALARCTTPEQAREQARRATASLRAAFEQLRSLPTEQRRSAGQELNRAKAAIERRVDARIQALAAEQPLAATHLSPTLPASPVRVGQVHPTVAVMRRMHAFFTALGFTVADGPEIESDWYNFSALNLPPEHPAREMHDTIYLREPGLLLRTHTSAMEIRAMQASPPPLRVIVPGKAYRAESVNATNNYMFFQYEVLAVERGLSMAHMRATIEAFLRYLFGAAARTRMRAKYYPQVEPGFGMDLQCRFCGGSGCAVCKGKGWIEILGGGMVHPNALAAVGLDWREHSGFAFGLGLDRLVMSATGIADIRQLYGPRMAYIPEV
ncbi:MAG TPA: phenylalanine--tRNA ligase subunit alpha [Roseiflexaceae bacterium]|nr:phenylalanine--tRNA ligase subunit alpha [Roseiflexaceae bacterium]